MEAFAHLVNRYKDPSLSLAVSILKDTAIAEDVLQEAFMKVYRSVGNFREEAAFSSWLYRIVVNHCYNALKSKRYGRQTEPLEAAEEPVAESGDSLKAGDQQYYVNKALEQLSADEALVLRLYYLHEMSLQEIKDITRFSPSKIKVCLHRGRKNMLQILEKMMGKEINYLL